MNSYIFVWKPPNIFPGMQILQNSLNAYFPNSRDGRRSYFFSRSGAGRGGEGQGQKSTGRVGAGKGSKSVERGT